MSTSIREFKKFLKEYQGEFSIYEKKLVKIILDNFKDIEKKSNSYGIRAKYISKLINEFADSTNTEIILSEENKIERKNQIKSLSKLTVKNFRGFSNEQVFEFKTPYTFVYGPNGTGKTSFCEALEYTLLGTIYEAEAKRINPENYIKNAYTKKSEAPKLKAINYEDVEIDLEPKAQVSEFCFIERNRIDGFSRISANTPQAQQQRLATLLGLEDFNAFVINFNESLDNYLDCEGENKKKLEKEEGKVKLYKENLKSIPEKRKNLQKENEELLSYYPNVEFIEDLKKKIMGTEEQEGLLKTNNKEINVLDNLKEENNPNIEMLLETIEILKNLINNRDKAENDLNSFKNEISLKDLYNAILKNEDNFDNVCPACESSLIVENKLTVPVNPYTNANFKIKEFETAIKLENQIIEMDKSILEKVKLVKMKISETSGISISINFKESKLIEELNIELHKLKTNAEIIEFIKKLQYNVKVFYRFEEYLITNNINVTHAKKNIEILHNKNKEIHLHLDKISTINTKKETIDKDEMNANKVIGEFNEQNKELIKRVKKEEEIVERNLQYSDAYKTFRRKIIEYNKKLPSVLSSNLNSKTLEFYNSINRFDHPNDLLEDIILPSNSSENIMLDFTNANNLNALHVLSEGHIRCLGLAILLAKNVEDDLPIIIFDDVVNAIDDEHRRGVIETILENKNIKNKQLIITTHGEEFIKQLEQNVSQKEHKEKVTRIDFLKKEDSQNIVVKLGSSKNYLVIAKDRLEDGHYRESLASARRALENMSTKLWKKLGENYKVKLSISMSSPGSPPDARNVTEQLRKYIKKNNLSETEYYKGVFDALSDLLGTEENSSLKWTYLNKGTHEEDRGEFDRTIIKEILDSLEDIDKYISPNEYE